MRASLRHRHRRWQGEAWIYKAHSYPTKVPHQAIMRFLLHYTEPGDLVLDGFAGSRNDWGLRPRRAARLKPRSKSRSRPSSEPLNGEARRAFLQDLAPNATFLAAGLNLPVDAAHSMKPPHGSSSGSTAIGAGCMRRPRPTASPLGLISPSGPRYSPVPLCRLRLSSTDAAFDEATEKVRDAFGCPACGAAVSRARFCAARQRPHARGDTIRADRTATGKAQWRTDGKTAGSGATLAT